MHRVIAYHHGLEEVSKALEWPYTITVLRTLG